MALLSNPSVPLIENWPIKFKLNYNLTYDVMKSSESGLPEPIGFESIKNSGVSNLQNYQLVSMISVQKLCQSDWFDFRSVANVNMSTWVSDSDAIKRSLYQVSTDTDEKVNAKELEHESCVSNGTVESVVEMETIGVRWSLEDDGKVASEQEVASKEVISMQ